MSHSGNLSLTVRLNPGVLQGLDVDWWIIALAGSSWYYMDNTYQWAPFNGNLSRCHPVYEGAMFNLPETPVLDINGLPVGSYTFWFAVDNPMDGILNSDSWLLYDSVTVNVQ